MLDDLVSLEDVFVFIFSVFIADLIMGTKLLHITIIVGLAITTTVTLALWDFLTQFKKKRNFSN